MTVQRADHQYGLRAYRTPTTPLLSEDHRARRLRFARANLKRDWTKVIFSDEKTWQLYHPPNKKNDVVWAHSRGEVRPLVKVRHPAKIHTWGGVSFAGKTPLHFFKENLTAKLYRNILETTLLPNASMLYPRGDWTLLQDSDPKHKAVATMQ